MEIVCAPQRNKSPSFVTVMLCWLWNARPLRCCSRRAVPPHSIVSITVPAHQNRNKNPLLSLKEGCKDFLKIDENGGGALLCALTRIGPDVCVLLNVAAQDLTCLHHISSTDQVAFNSGCFLQAKEELLMENQRLKDENGALIRVITKLSK